MTDILVIFDCDGVLVDSEIIACRIEAEELTRIGYPISVEEDIRRFAGKSQKSIMATVTETLGCPLPDDFEQTLHAKIIKTLSDDLEPIPGIATALEQIPHKCVASSGSPDKIANSLSVTSLADFFDPAHLFSAVMVKQGKPAPDLFLYAAEQMGFAPEQCCVVEDSVYGVQAGVAAGMTVFGFVGGSHIIDPEHATRLREAGAHVVFDNMETLSILMDGVKDAA